MHFSFRSMQQRSLYFWFVMLILSLVKFLCWLVAWGISFSPSPLPSPTHQLFDHSFYNQTQEFTTMRWASKCEMIKATAVVVVSKECHAMNTSYEHHNHSLTILRKHWAWFTMDVPKDGMLHQNSTNVNCERWKEFRQHWSTLDKQPVNRTMITVARNEWIINH